MSDVELRWCSADVRIRQEGDWHGSAGPHWYRVPERIADDPALGFGSLVALPPDEGHPDGNIGWVREITTETISDATRDLLRVIPPEEWGRHGFRGGLFYDGPVENYEFGAAP